MSEQAPHGRSRGIWHTDPDADAVLPEPERRALTIVLAAGGGVALLLIGGFVVAGRVLG